MTLYSSCQYRFKNPWKLVRNVENTFCIVVSHPFFNFFFLPFYQFLSRIVTENQWVENCRDEKSIANKSTSQKVESCVEIFVVKTQVISTTCIHVRLCRLILLAEHRVHIDSSFLVDRVWRSLFVCNLELQPRLRQPPSEIRPPFHSSSRLIVAKKNWSIEKEKLENRGTRRRNSFLPWLTKAISFSCWAGFT